MCPCIRVWAGYGARGTAAAASGLPGKEVPSLEGAWGGCRHSLTPKPPAAGASHACGVGFGVPIEAETRVGWLLGGCTSLADPTAALLMGVYGYRFSPSHPRCNQVLTPFLDTPQPLSRGAHPPHQSSQGGEAPHTPPALLLWLQLPPCPPWGRGGGQIQQCVVVGDSSA